MDWLEIGRSLPRGLHVAATLSLFGCLVFRSFVVPDDAVAGIPRIVVIRVGLASALLALAFGGAWLVVTSAAITNADNLGSALAALPIVARHSRFGNFICLRLLLLALALLMLARQKRRIPVVSLIASGAAVALQPLLGHIGALAGSARVVLLPIEIAHLLAAGAWLGGLLPLLLCVAWAVPKLATLLCERFTPVGLIAVGTIAVTALPQAGALIGDLPELIGTQYGHMAMIKIGLFALALGLACLNRLALTARIGRGLARRWLIASIAAEAVIGLCVVLAAAAMASSVPAAHEQPIWPFAWRPSTIAWQEPELRTELTRLLIAAAVAVTLVGFSLLIRRFRIAAAVLAAIVIAPFVSSLSLLLVVAYPTSYFRSTSGFSVDAIVRGEVLFGQQCAICHDPQNGSGGAADLTASHIWGHLNGELFWWITNGVTDPEGAALMPGFGPMFSDDDRWALIDFIHARNVGWQARDDGQWSPPIGAPATPLRCDGSDAGSLADLAQRVLTVTAGSDAGDASDSVTIRLYRDSTEAPAPGECVAAAPAAWEAWRVLAGIAPQWFPGFRAIVDGRGWMRAWIRPDATREQLLAAIRDARDHPIVEGATAGGLHQH
jgi:putative copper export protein/mono/diheme cytochrome c family protein